MTIYVGSLKFSPIYKSHVCAFGKSCEEKGYSVKYLFAKEYEWLLSKEEKSKTIFIGNSTSILSMLKDALNFKQRERIIKVFSENPPSHVYMHNYHLLNNFIAKLSKKYAAKFIYHVHEPYVENKGAHGGFQKYWLHLFEYFQEKLLENTEVAIVSSNAAYSLFEERYPDFRGKKVLVPLMYEDLGDNDPSIFNRDFISFVGPPVPAKNPEKFLEIVQFSIQHNLGLKFLLISRIKINDIYRQGNLEVFTKEKISDEEYGDLIKKSVVVLTPYKRETQSSVILVSYMYGTPVVSSNVGGLPEFVTHGKTGYLLDVNAEPDQWIKGILFVQDNFSSLSEACREYFVNNFSGKNWYKYLDIVLK
jgi:glycosyltransferase involved in cell wall biosynthesis